MRYLVVAHHDTPAERDAVREGNEPVPLGHDAVRNKVSELMRSDPTCEVHLLVPATPSPERAWVWTREEARDLAQKRLDYALAVARKAGANLTGEIGDEYVIDSIQDILRRERFDAIIISTPPLGVSKLFHQDMVSRISRVSGLPVTHVVDSEGRRPGPSPG